MREQLPSARMIGFRRKGTTPLLNPDFTVNETASLESEYGIELFSNIDEAYAQKPDLAVIATPTALHAAQVVEAAERGVDVFVEKPGAASLDQAREVISTVRSSGVRFFISYQRRFHPLVVKLRKILQRGDIGKLMSVRVVIASHVPDWHPYEDFRGLYACRSELGGGVLRTEIHEIDLVTWLFGMPERVCAAGGLRGRYDIDVEDSAELLMDYGLFAAQLSLCFMQKKQERRLSITGQDGWIELDLISQRLGIGHHNDEITETFTDSFDNDSLFRAQMDYFLNHFERDDEQHLDALERNLTIISRCENSINH